MNSGDKIKVSKSSTNAYSQLLGLCYLSFILNFAFLLPLACAVIYRKNKIFSFKALQSGVLQFFLWLISLVLFIWSSYEIYRFSGTPYSELVEGKWAFWEATGNWLIRIILLIMSWKAFHNKNIRNIPFVTPLSRCIAKFWNKKTIEKAVALNLLLPGLGNIYLNNFIFGLVSICTFFLFAGIFCFLCLLSRNPLVANDLLNIAGFYFALEVSRFVPILTSSFILIFFGASVLLVYALSVFSLFKRGSKILTGSFLFSIFLNTGFLCSLFLIPIIISNGQLIEGINKRAQEIYKELVKLSKEKEKNKEQAKKIEIPQRKLEREMKFDLVLTERVKGLNEFDERKFMKEELLEEKKAKVGFYKEELKLPSIKEYSEAYSAEENAQKSDQNVRYIKSYSEYLTAKVREDKRDLAIWKNNENRSFSMVVQYTIEKDGRISNIDIIEGSNDLNTDSIVLAVIESMSPVLTPPENKRLKVTELFWNSGYDQQLGSGLKNLLLAYPDGRVIQEI